MRQLIDSLAFNLLLVGYATGNDETKNPVIDGANRAAAALLGYGTHELSGLALEQILAPASLTLCRAALARAGDRESAECFEAELLARYHSFPALVTVSTLPSPRSDFGKALLLIQAIDPANDFLVMRRVIEQSASAMMVTDASGRIVYVNPRFSLLSGYAEAELLGQTPSLLQSGKMSAQDYQDLWRQLTVSGEWQGEICNRHQTGREYWVAESISAIKDSLGNTTHYLAVAEDITGRKTVESALAESEQRFRQMADLSGEWLWEQDPKGYYLYSSIAVEQILGLTPTQIIGKHYTELLTAQDQQAHVDLSSSQQSFHALVNHYRHRDGHPVITESTGLPLLDADGKLVKWRGVDRDITARMQYQNALIESEKRTRLIIESSINAIVIMDADGIVTDWNRRAEQMFGWSAESAIGRRLEHLIIPLRFRAAHRNGMRRFLETGNGTILNRQTEQVALRRDGSEFPVEISVAPLKLGDSYIFSGFIHDISGRKAAERQIRQAQVELAVAQNELKIAQQIQAGLSPAAPLKTGEFEITGVCLPADKVGGDYFDYFYRDGGRLDIVIADVSGHSIGPALFMVETRSAIRMKSSTEAGPEAVLSALNRFLFNDLNRADYFLTLFYLQVDPERRQLHFANAGHPPPLLFNRHSRQFTELDADGLIVGLRQDVCFERKSVELAEGDLIVLYTDGLVEAENAELGFFGLDRVKSEIAANADLPPQAIIDGLFGCLRRFCGSEKFADDITVLVFKWH
ncbi:PAS domain S-box protein [Methylomonas koyamae]|uniref:PAS domain S-box protein n=1 Tax=Methylomonas koyamae TaxID=702114 RepID=UPI00112D8DC9|nr:PAS domain S-box protein [Methylomonas koyamae]TPQ29082.1 histidine kinase [Methylomonas koyamae]